MSAGNVPGTNVPPISFPGIVSGVDYNAIIKQLTSLTLAPTVGLNASVATLNNANLELININNMLACVQNSLQNLSNPNLYDSYDATSTDEISFGDNDALAAHVAVLLRARLLVLLTSVPGVLREGVLIEDGAAARSAVFGPASSTGRGGMESKVAAAELAAGAGIPTMIAGGTGSDVLTAALAGRAPGTRFAAAEAAPAFKLWLQHGKRIAGRITVDGGARRAIVDGGASLLAVGVTGWEGDFRAGDGVEIAGPDGVTFAKGIASVNATELRDRPIQVEAVNRDRLVLHSSH